MGNIKALAGQTVVYGFSTIFGRLLSWFMLPLYVRYMSESDNGLLTYLYSYIAIIQVILAFGFETGFFRFAKNENLNKVFGTLFSFVAAFSFVFVLLVFVFVDPISTAMGINDRSLVLLVSFILGADAIGNLPFALLRHKNQAFKYALFRLLQVIIMVGLNLFFLVVYPKYSQELSFLECIGILPDNLLFNVFYSNLMGSLFIPIVLIKSTVRHYSGFDYKLFKQVLVYSFPILIVGIFGMVNYNLDKILLPHLIKSDNGFGDLGVYGANYKIGVLMAIFTQSFRLAFEPFLFKNKSEGNEVYALIMNYFVAFGMLIFVGVMISVDLVNILITDNYKHGNIVIPFVLMGQLFFGIYYNLSLWYKVIDKTYFGTIFTIIGSVVCIVGNVVLIPILGYIGAAISTLLCNLAMMLISFIVGQKHFFIPYEIKKVTVLVLSGLMVYCIAMFNPLDTLVYKLIVNYLLFGVYGLFLWRYLGVGSIVSKKIPVK
ncbi:MAG: polysaccharide biosynthesis C-terminal domain-containing protein [Breznakibacter sp.]